MRTSKTETLVMMWLLTVWTWPACGPETGATTKKNAPTSTAPAEAAKGPAAEIGPHGIRAVNPAIYVADPPRGQPTPQRTPSIDQAQLLAGDIPLYDLLEAGQAQFNVPFEAVNGHGEGRSGPRSQQRAYWNPRGGTVEDPEAWTFLRVNGIDSQSCFECHNTIGVAVPSGAKTTAMVRKPGAQGGPAGAASSAFINDQFPEYAGQPNTVLTKFVRNPPVVFGTGYTQELAAEMTTDLQALATAARLAGTSQPNTKQTVPLASKAVEFGSFSTTCTGPGSDSCTDDTSAVVGVQGDLVVRPFQWGGIASSVRHFARDALDFHFSVQAVEKVGHGDCDLDGLIDEITVGNVTALTAYVTMFRPPAQQIPAGSETVVARGRAVLDEIGCTDCHRATMPMVSPTMTIMTPPEVAANAPCPAEVASLVNPQASAAGDLRIEADKRIAAALGRDAVKAAIAAPGATPAQIFAALQPALHDDKLESVAAGNYQIDLNLTGMAPDQVPAYVWPRLPANTDNSVDVPLFSDLKLHFMGKQLSDDFAQPTDGVGYSAQPGYYVTRVLWGVGDTDPYMHDGRARSLQAAIELHGVDGSEAAPAASKFAALSPADQDALLAFLSSLRLPVAVGTEQAEYQQSTTPRPAK